MARVAELGFSKDMNRLEAVVPHGTLASDLPKIIECLFLKDIISRLPRGCDNCISGHDFVIRERLEDVIRIDLDKRVVIGG